MECPKFRVKSFSEAKCNFSLPVKKGTGYLFIKKPWEVSGIQLSRFTAYTPKFYKKPRNSYGL